MSYAHLVHDVTHTECHTQHGSAHVCGFTTFSVNSEQTTDASGEPKQLAHSGPDSWYEDYKFESQQKP